MNQYETAIEAVMLAAQIILESGGETYRAEETLLRMCQGFGFPSADIIAFPTGFFVSFELPDGTKRSHAHRIRERAIFLDDINEVNSISRLVAQSGLAPDEALIRLKALRSDSKNRPLLSAFAFAFSSAFFAIMFRGGLIDFGISFVTGFILQSLMPLYKKLHAPAPLVSLFSGLIGASCALLMLRFFGGSQEATIAGSLMPLLPGLSMTNAVRDTMRGDLVSGLARSAEALFSVFFLAAGVAVVLML